MQLLHAGTGDLYANGMSSLSAEFVDTLVKVDVTGATPTLTWHRDGCYCGEPIFVASPGATAEDDGVVLSLVLDTTGKTVASSTRGPQHTSADPTTQPVSFLLVVNATTFDQIALAPLSFLGAPVPMGFHGRVF